MLKSSSLGNYSGEGPVSRRGVSIAVICIVLAALGAYANSFSGPFVFDDGPSIETNRTIRQLWPLGQTLHPPSAAGVAGRPVLNFSFALNYAIGGPTVWSYHALNVLVHVLGGLTLFGVVRRTLSRMDQPFGVAAAPLALAVAVLWLVHPAQTASVTYISQRAESLMALWYLLTVYCFIRATELSQPIAHSLHTASGRLERSPGPGRLGWSALAVLVCGLGMATKETMITAPVVILLYDRVFIAENWAALRRRRWGLHLALVGTWAILAWLMAGVTAQGRGYGGGVSWWGYAWTESRVVLQYVRLALWPHPLVFDWGMEAGGSPTVFHALLLTMLVGLALTLFWRRPRIGFAAVLFFAILAPTSSLVPVVDQPMAENRVYLALAGVAVLVVCALYRLLGRRVWPLVSVLAVGCILVTARRNEDYRTEVGLWRDTVLKNPDN
ncbi:MAG: hypothetical protein ABIR80_07095, partial [Opitutaceae bacterium]